MYDNTVTKTALSGLSLFNRGKVRDIYDLDEHLLIVVTDRVSAFDVILPDGIPFKGMVLNQMSAYWFDVMKEIIPNHVVSCNVDDYPASCKPYADVLRDRSMLVKKADPLPVECVVRGYISGSLWKEYKAKCVGGELQTGDNDPVVEVCGIDLPIGLKESSRFPTPLFTPATKAELGDHDENISFAQAKEIVGDEVADRVRDVSVQIYQIAVGLAEKRGIIIADTKFEFGLYGGELIIIDEMLSPDSSRFWPLDEYSQGSSQPSFDKQFVRDYLASLRWDKCPPAPALPDEIVEQTSLKYLQAFEMLTGRNRSELGVEV